MDKELTELAEIILNFTSAYTRKVDADRCIAQVQAEISFKAGKQAAIKEVVEWITLHNY